MNNSIREINVDEIAQVNGGGVLTPLINALYGAGDATLLLGPTLTQVVQLIADGFFDAGDYLSTP